MKLFNNYRKNKDAVILLEELVIASEQEMQNCEIQNCVSIVDLGNLFPEISVDDIPEISVDDNLKKMVSEQISSCRNQLSFDELDNLAKETVSNNARSKIAYLKNFVINIVGFTINWLRDKIINKLYKKKAKKVAVLAMKNMVASCSNHVALSELSGLAEDGYTYIMAEIDNSGKIQDIEYIKDTNRETDRNVRNFINKTGQGMVIVSG